MTTNIKPELLTPRTEGTARLIDNTQRFAGRRRHAMRRAKLLASCTLALAAFGITPVIASAETAPPPPESPGCKGRIVATFNHNSGIFGASENPKSSAGPGYFLKTETPNAVHGVMEAFCS